MDRRKFLQKFGLGAGGAVASVSVAPGLFEGLWDWLASLKPVRKLKAVWTINAAQDFAAMHGIEERLVARMAEDIRKEIDREILETLKREYDSQRTDRTLAAA